MMRRRMLLRMAGALGLVALFGIALEAVPLDAQAAGAETPLPFANNLPQLAAEAAKQGLPLILLVSLTDCPYCEQLRRQQLVPLSKTGVPVWQIHLDTEGRMVNFDGKPVTERQFAKDIKVRVAPTVFFFDAKGRQVVEPLVGTMLDDFYSAYLEDALATARLKIAAAR
jgi:hypothetical protein